MNRRTVLRSGAVLATVGIAGCIDGVQEHFQGEIQSPVPIEIFNESDQTHNIRLEAIERGTDRGTYDQGYSVTPGERVSAPSLDGFDQSFRVMRIDQSGDEDWVEVGTVTDETQLIQITIYDDDLELEISTDEEDEPALDGNESEGDELEDNETEEFDEEEWPSEEE
ncbi:hypothetical protein [Halostagnicola bangensis]